VTGDEKESPISYTPCRIFDKFISVNREYTVHRCDDPYDAGKLGGIPRRQMKAGTYRED